MPTYEMPVLLRIMRKRESVDALKRIANSIFQTGGFIRKLEYWGDKQLPCKTSIHGKVHREAGYFFFSFDAPPISLQDLSDECNRDIDIVRSKIYKPTQTTPPPNYVCTLEEELLPPAYRPSILKLLEAKKKTKTRPFKYNSGLDYYPFLK
ncbi:mitochondrial ribosomal protein S6 [Megalopta genalis]|uniref:mitochondrial ribosomal protein S6 n=1 Tax=Megalopta genalis TaxID=115081 RepID=UPI003FD68A31